MLVRNVILVSAIVSLLSGCTWVSITDEAQQVLVVPANRVSTCQRVGVISSTSKSAVIGISRSAEKVQTELDNLAREEAVTLGANTIVRQQVVEGKSSYIAYSCP